MTNSAFDIMQRVEELDTNDLEHVQLWVEFTLTKRALRSSNAIYETLIMMDKLLLFLCKFFHFIDNCYGR